MIARRATARRIALALLAGAAALCGCGGSKGQPASSALTLTAQASGPAQSLGGVELTVVLPAGVTVATDGAGNPSEGVLAASGGAAGGPVVLAGHYTAATSTDPAKIKLVLVKSSGFDLGEFATLTYAFAGRSPPSAAEFVVVGAKVVDRRGTSVAGVDVKASSATR